MKELFVPILGVLAMFAIAVGSIPASKSNWNKAKTELNQMGYEIINQSVQEGLFSQAIVIVEDKNKNRFLIKMSGDKYAIKNIEQIGSKN